MIAGVIIKGFQILTFNKSKIVKTNANKKEIKNFNRDNLVLDSKIGKKTNTYPINTPMHAVKNHDKPLV